jgi:hypothetical protein
MSTAGVEAKKSQTEAYFRLHPDSITVTVVGTGDTFPAVYDSGSFSNNRDGGNVRQNKHAPHLTFYSEYAALIPDRKAGGELSFNGTTREVNIVKPDLTETTFQAEAWLV